MTEQGSTDGETQQQLLNVPSTHNDGILMFEKESKVQTPFFTSQRWILGYLGVVFGVVSYIYRVNMSIALVCMAKLPESPVTEVRLFNTSMNSSYIVVAPEIPTTGGQCVELSSNMSADSQTTEFTWGKTQQSLVLSAYYYGYIVPQVAGGWLAGQYGGKHVITVTMAISAVTSLLMPVLARLSVYTIMIARIILGLCSGASIPAYFALVGVWALPYERSRLISLCWFGQVAGTIIGYATSGLLCAHGFDNGWGSIFYVHGLTGLLFVVCWQFCVYNSPELHPRITSTERELLSNNSHRTKNITKRPVPWRDIFTYVPVWAVFITHIGDTWTFYLILICLPLYLKEVLKFDIQSNGVFSSLPFICMGVGLLLAGWLADRINAKHWFTRTRTRKIFQVVGLLGSGAFLIIAGYITCDKRMIVIMCMCLSTFAMSLGTAAGYPCNPIDMSPLHGSIIFGISNSIATIPGMLAPLAVAELTQNQTSEEWRVVFFVVAGISALASLVYAAFSSSELAPWAEDTSQEIEIEVEKNGSIT